MTLTQDFSCKRFRLTTLWSGFVLCISLANPAQSETTTTRKDFVIACSIPPEHESYQPVAHAYQQMLKAHDFRIQIKNVPPARTFHQLHHGQADAVCLVSRLSLHRFGHKNGFSLDVTLGKSKINAWTLNPRVVLSEYMLDNITQLQIGFLKNHTADFFIQRRGFVKGVAVKDVSMAAKMMINGRLDAMLMIETVDYEETLKYWLEKQESGSSETLRSTSIANIQYVPYLHERHLPIKASLETALQKVVARNGGPISRSSIKSWLKNSQ